LLYQEFLPLLPVLLQNLNELQTGLHKQYLKDLFVELCLTVPVRLSSLLPYLPMLMDPLVSALNGTPTLISQGLRTLELCVDNLQTDFLYDHIQPVRTDLIQGLWRVLNNQTDSIAQTAFRVLGKLGGSNRKMIVEPQKLNYNLNPNNCKEFNGPTFKVFFSNYPSNIEISLEKLLNTCESLLKSSNVDLFYKQHAFKIVASFLGTLITTENNKSELLDMFINFKPFNNSAFNQFILKSIRFDDEHLRKMVEVALNSLFYATSVKDLRQQSIGFLDSLFVHFTLLSLAHYHNQDEAKFNSHANELTNLAIRKHQSSNYLDFMIAIDSLFSVLCYDDIDYWPVVQRMILITIEVSEIVSGGAHLTHNYSFGGEANESVIDEKNLGRPNLANVSLFDYLGEKINQLCHERSWFAKKAG
jgi:transformation/transcription domain-associated protein